MRTRPGGNLPASATERPATAARRRASLVLTLLACAAPAAAAPLPVEQASTAHRRGLEDGSGPFHAARNRAAAPGWSSSEIAAWKALVAARVRDRWGRTARRLLGANSPTAGKATVRFVVRRDGRVDDVGLAVSSGDAALDEAALTAIRTMGALPPPRSSEPFRLTVPLAYRPRDV